MKLETLCACLALVYAGDVMAARSLSFPGQDIQSRKGIQSKDKRNQRKIPRKDTQDANLAEKRHMVEDKYNKKDTQDTNFTEKRHMTEDEYNEWMAAVNQGNIEVIQSFINKNYDVDAHFPGRYKNKTALSWAVNDHEDIVKLLLNNGADVNVVDFSGTPLCQAVREINTDMVKLLLKSGADPNAGAERHLSPLIEAIKYLDSYRKFGTKEGVSNLIKIIKLLAGYGVRTNHTDYDGETPLMIVAKNGDVEVANILISISSKETLNAKNKKGMTALSIAQEENHKEIANLLLERAAKQATSDKKVESWMKRFPTDPNYSDDE